MLPTDALRDTRLSLRDIRVLAAISCHADHAGTCSHDRSVLATHASVTEPQVSVATTRLVGFGWIEKAGNGKAVKYRIAWGATVPESGTVQRLQPYPNRERLEQQYPNREQLGLWISRQPYPNRELFMATTVPESGTVPPYYQKI